MGLEHAYKTQVAQRGLRLSGGQRQCLAIARMLLKKPKIIILDEATAALDNLTEREVQIALANLCQGRTTVVVAHRLSTVTQADLILVIEDGRIVERGTHGELVKQCGIYTDMWEEQVREETEA